MQQLTPEFAEHIRRDQNLSTGAKLLAWEIIENPEADTIPRARLASMFGIRQRNLIRWRAELVQFGYLPPSVPVRRLGKRHNIKPRQRFAVLMRDGFRCVYCGKTSADVELDVDHKLPSVDGGRAGVQPGDISNLVTACIECNEGKGRLRLTIEPVPGHSIAGS